jgi:hypothetical protein
VQQGEAAAMIVTVLYYVLIAYIAGLIVWNLFKSRKWQDELLYVIILMPFILRLLRLK